MADEGSFTQAAASLRINQSGVSTQVQKLERLGGIEVAGATDPPEPGRPRRRPPSYVSKSVPYPAPVDVEPGTIRTLR